MDSSPAHTFCPPQIQICLPEARHAKSRRYQFGQTAVCVRHPRLLVLYGQWLVSDRGGAKKYILFVTNNSSATSYSNLLQFLFLTAKTKAITYFK